MKRIFRSKIFWTLLIFLFVIRLLVPLALLPKLNKFLANFSPTFKGHASGIGLNVFRGAYKLKGLELRLRDKPDERFFYAKYLDISISLRDLIRGQITTNVLVNGAQIVMTTNVVDAFRKTPKKEQEETKKNVGKLFPLKVERVDIQNSSFEFSELASIPESSRWRISNIDGRLSNATPGTQFPLSLLTINGSMFDSTILKIAGQLNQLSKPTAWDLDVEVREFDLRRANPMIAQKLPLSFTSGKVDAYSEVKSEGNKIVGYIKPFVKHADVVANRETFEGVKNFGVEVSTAAVNLILRDAKDKVLATKVLFSYENGDFKINSLEALSKAIQNGFAEDIPPGIDDEIGLSAKQQKTETKGETL